ncbi:DUF4252 domain-containing protein [Litoribacter ruber]|uniref:DUF4252 domain-containing protein n=1 Tax=Litoribacter ruber TaxID=702568 RepID=A0AAP2G1B6_9BACT|nr:MULTISPECIES: DUF4252 domain-containing protein [Litoribacter]MBS9524329.1 DUF4252 domain-containing protein [Litoribacter alkaliphilus]MBT0809872.1 DUF4252 domain-containing protein [Litoribacter ruber]
MKKILITLICLLAFTGVQAQDDAIVRFFSKYMEDERFSRVYISPKMMQMAGGFMKSNADGQTKKDEKDMGELISKVRGIRILTADKIDGLPLYKEAMGTLTRNKYEDLMDVQDKSSSVKFMVREERGRVKELLMITGSGDSFTLLSMLGDFTYQDLNILAENTNMPGMKEYEKGNRK